MYSDGLKGLPPQTNIESLSGEKAWEEEPVAEGNMVLSGIVDGRVGAGGLAKGPDVKAVGKAGGPV